MRILYIDIDSLRPDHLGCYGYHRDTSPNIDRLAAEGVRLENCHISDAPCLPSRTALFSGRFGIHTGVVDHGGPASQPFIEQDRGFASDFWRSCWMAQLRAAGYRTATVSPFAERHTAWHFLAFFQDVHFAGRWGADPADKIAPVAIDWLNRHGCEDNWFLHVNFWDPHTTYNTPESFGNPFMDDPLPAWYTEEIRQMHWQGCGMQSAQEGLWFELHRRPDEQFEEPRQPAKIDSMSAARKMFDGYDCGVRFADEHVGHLLDKLAELGVLDDTAVVVSADHGENLGEMNVYMGHRLADQITTRVPMIIRWPGVTDSCAGAANGGLHYQVDVAATIAELAGAKIPYQVDADSIGMCYGGRVPGWDGRSFAADLRAGRDGGRNHLVLSMGAIACQRSVRFGDHLCIRTYHDAFQGFPDVMLFNVKDDPHEQHDLAGEQPAAAEHALSLLEQWRADMMRTSFSGVDPMDTVLARGGPHHTHGYLPRYLEYLRQTGRGQCADLLQRRHKGQFQTHNIQR